MQATNTVQERTIQLAMATAIMTSSQKQVDKQYSRVYFEAFIWLLD